MGKLLCRCGETLSNCLCPNEVQGILLRDIDMERAEERDWNPFDAGRIVWECSVCGRLAISFPRLHDANIKWYRPEDGVPLHLMAFEQKPQPDRP